MQSHAAAEIFPMMVGCDLDALVADIRDNGQREPIILHDGLILDGRNRFAACKVLGITPLTAEWDGHGTPEAFVVSMNLHRRHLNDGQRAMVAARLATRTRQESLIPNASNLAGKLEVQKSPSSMTAAEAGELLNVGRSSVLAAKRVLSDGAPEDIEAIEEGRKGVNSIYRDILGKPIKRKPRNDAPLSESGRNPERIQRRQMHADIWAQLSGALEALSGLPLSSDVAAIVASNFARTRSVDETLSRSLQWLKDFENDWRNRDQNAA